MNRDTANAMLYDVNPADIPHIRDAAEFLFQEWPDKFDVFCNENDDLFQWFSERAEVKRGSPFHLMFVAWVGGFCSCCEFLEKIDRVDLTPRKEDA